MDSEFQDIRIVGYDEKQTTRDEQRPGLYHVHFRLSADPPTEWAEAFEHSRANTMASLRWPVEVSGEFIVAMTPLDRMQDILNQMKEHVRYANHQYRARLAKRQQDVAAQKAEEDEADRQKREALQKLKFD